MSPFKFFSGFIFVSAAGVFGSLGLVHADDADVLPQGRWRLRVVSAFTEAGNEFSASGDTRSYGSTFSRSIDPQFLSAFDAKVGDAAKAAKLAGLGDIKAISNLNVNVDTSMFTNVLAAEYGLTDRISVGLLLPVVRGSVDVDAQSSADADFQAQMSKLPDGHPLKTGLQKMAASTTVDALNSALQGRLGYSSGIESWDATGFGDLEVGAKANYFDTHPIKSTLKAGLRLPTGRADDPDMLMDVGFGDGQFDIGAYNYFDYHVLGNLSFTVETGYTAQLSNTDNYRLPLSAEVPLGAQTAKLERNLGDYWEAGLEGNYTLFKRLITSAKYRFKQKFEDSYSAEGIDASLLEANTDEILHEVNGQIEYSNLADVRAGTSRMPYALAIFYRQPVAGENIPDTRTGGIQAKVYF